MLKWKIGDVTVTISPKLEGLVLFGDRAHRLLYNDGPLVPSTAAALFTGRALEIRSAVVAETARDLIMEMDGEGRLLYASPTLEPLLGYAPEELQGTTPFYLVHPDDVESIVGSFLESFEARTSGYVPPHRVKRSR